MTAVERGWGAGERIWGGRCGVALLPNWGVVRRETDGSCDIDPRNHIGYEKELASCNANALLGLDHAAKQLHSVRLDEANPNVNPVAGWKCPCVDGNDIAGLTTAVLEPFDPSGNVTGPKSDSYQIEGSSEFGERHTEMLVAFHAAVDRVKLARPVVAEVVLNCTVKHVDIRPGVLDPSKFNDLCAVGENYACFGANWV